jgi:hypothetical protein
MADAFNPFKVYSPNELSTKSVCGTPGQPFGLQEYYASCFSNGLLTLLVLLICRHSQNILHSPTHSASLTISSQHPAANHAHISLIGKVTVFQDWDNVPDEWAIKTCYLAQHLDSSWWLPNNNKAAHIVCFMVWSCSEAVENQFSVLFAGILGTLWSVCKWTLIISIVRASQTRIFTLSEDSESALHSHPCHNFSCFDH